MPDLERREPTDETILGSRIKGRGSKSWTTVTTTVPNPDIKRMQTKIEPFKDPNKKPNEGKAPPLKPMMGSFRIDLVDVMEQVAKELKLSFTVVAVEDDFAPFDPRIRMQEGQEYVSVGDDGTGFGKFWTRVVDLYTGKPIEPNR